MPHLLRGHIRARVAAEGKASPALAAQIGGAGKAGGTAAPRAVRGRRRAGAAAALRALLDSRRELPSGVLELERQVPRGQLVLDARLDLLVVERRGHVRPHEVAREGELLSRRDR